MTNLYDFDKHKYLLSSSEWQASVRSVKVFLFYIKRHLMSGNEFACSLGSSSAIIAWVWTQKTRWKTLANNARRYSSRCVRAFSLNIQCFLMSDSPGKPDGRHTFFAHSFLSSCMVSQRYATLMIHASLHFWKNTLSNTPTQDFNRT